tara:strand:+ start:891 stop:1385 length:495 start_codon:yes stop_codon:yes gene_type:complete
MSFTNNSLNYNLPNYISTYYILTPRLLRNSNNTIFGDISVGYSISEINTIVPDFSQLPHSIIRNITNESKKYIVGIPKYNGNNISRKKIYTAMSLYDIDFLRTIIPYKKMRGNDTTVSENLQDCSGGQFLTNGNVMPLTVKEINSIINKLNIHNKICLRNTRYS